jgi:hypothetical protein
MWAWVSMIFPLYGAVAGVLAMTGVPPAESVSGVVVTGIRDVLSGTGAGRTGAGPVPCWVHPEIIVATSRSRANTVAVRMINAVPWHW